MSNIELKGDVIQNLGEYLPNPYIDKIIVEDEPSPDSTLITLNVFYSLMFLISDEYDITDIKNQIENINFYCSLRKDQSPEPKRSLINELVYPGSDFTGIRDLATGSEISSLLDNSQNYRDDLYDQEDRRILKVNGKKVISFTITNTASFDFNVYFYAFGSTIEKPEYSPFGGLPPQQKYLNTSNVAYEKLFSEGLTVLREEEVVFIDKGGNKYGQTPILGLDRIFYKNQTITREFIISKVTTLLKRFENRSIGPLADSINSIKSVISNEATGQNLLVELDKVRRSFPNKTNNNPLGNLYSAYSVLLQNINSAFPTGEAVTKNKYLTGKVVDLREGLSRGYERQPVSDAGNYFSEDLFFIHRERASSDETADAGINKATFFIRYEEWLKKQSNIFRLISQEKFYEIATDQDLNNLRRILFSYFRIKSLFIFKSHKEDTAEYLIANWGTERDNRKMGNLEITREVFGKAARYAFLGDETEAGSNIVGHTFKEHNFGFQNPAERLLAFTYSDIDTYSALYEMNEIEQNGAMVFKYHASLQVYDETNDFVVKMIEKFNQVNESLQFYTSLANEICSYNNIDDKFNDFFSKSIRDRPEFVDGVYPWEIGPTLYSIMAYLITDEFESFEDVIKYCKNVSATISPENGTRQSLVNFAARMQDLADSQIVELQENSSTLSNQTRINGFEKEYALIPFNYAEFRSEQSQELQFLQDSSVIRVPRLDPPEITEDGFYRDQSTAGREGPLSIDDLGFTGVAATSFYIFLREDIELLIDSAWSDGMISRLQEDYGEVAGIDSSSATNVVFSTMSAAGYEANRQIYKRRFAEALDLLLSSIITVYRTKRNEVFLTQGMNYPFDSALPYIEDGNYNEEYIQLAIDTYKSTIENLRSEIVELLVPVEDGYYFSGDFFSNVTAFSFDTVHRIMSYYRDNTHKLMRDISALNMLLLTSDRPFTNEILLETLQFSLTGEGVMPADSNYQGPAFPDIANYEDISL